VKGTPLQLFGSDTDENLNGSAPPRDDDEFPEDEEEEFHDYSTLFDAPSYSEFIKTAPNSKAKSYEKRVQSMMKAGMVMSLNSHQWPDAATFMKHGPGFAKAAGNLAAEDARAARLVDMMTAPDSPYVMFAMVAIPLVAQLFRNHASDIESAASTASEKRKARKAAKREARATGFKARTPPITVRIFRREFKIPIRFRLKLPKFKAIFSSFLAPTQHPEEIAGEVFSDPAVVKALHKMGLFPREAPDDNAT
jgi:hypothetical protein